MKLSSPKKRELTSQLRQGLARQLCSRVFLLARQQSQALTQGYTYGMKEVGDTETLPKSWNHGEGRSMVYLPALLCVCVRVILKFQAVLILRDCLDKII